MRKLRSVGVVGAALAGAFGLGAFACSSATTSSPGGAPEGGAGTDGGGGVGPDAGAGGGDGGAGADGSSTTSTACKSPVPLVLGGKDTGYVLCDGNVLHRASVVDCPVLLPRPDGGANNYVPLVPDGGVACRRDSDCAAKALGWCGFTGGHFPEPVCKYGCVRDADCASGEICRCADPVGACVPSSCVDDTKCAPGALCASVKIGWGGCSWDPLPERFACQSSGDKCFTDKDCTTTSPACGWDVDAGVRGCGPAQLACPGRPFLVEGTARVAATVTRGDWRAEGPRPCVPIDAGVREEIARYWLRVAAMEHASVAAFARFALELLSLGAPVELVVATNQAMSDETEHARLAFGLASAYAGAAKGPGPLPMNGALGEVDRRRFFATLVREGCIGETVAAVLATEAGGRAKDGAVRTVLARIAADETRHSELAWRAAGWVIGEGDEAFRTWAREEIARAIGEEEERVRGAGTGAGAGGGAGIAEEHGVLGGALEAEIAVSTLRDLVEPCARTLFGATGERRGARGEGREARA